jgi:hypothetical protein
MCYVCKIDVLPTQAQVDITKVGTKGGKVRELIQREYSERCPYCRNLVYGRIWLVSDKEITNLNNIGGT